MIDLETTGTSAGCCILSIAAVPFATEFPMDVFYETISHKLSKDAGFFDEEETLAWWNKQKSEIQEEAFSGTRSPKAVLETLAHYLQCLDDIKNIYIWGNGKDFDNVILAAAYKKLGLKQPWSFRNNVCYRDLARNHQAIPYQKPEAAHNALNDAMAQARHAAIILSSSFPPSYPK